MSFATIATWKSAELGMNDSLKLLSRGGSAKDAVLGIIKSVEDDPHYKSVGFGGLPNEDGIVQTDAAYMDGDTLAVGAVAALEGFASPVEVAEKLSHEKFNNMLAGKGAGQYASEHKFENKDMLSEHAKRTWQKRVSDVQEHNLSPYDGHDTIGCVALDNSGSMVAATSTSGLFMKMNGRTGDSPIVGSGLYVDSKVGGACATGLGEDLMKGVLTYEIVRLMSEGHTPQDAADAALWSFIDKLKERKQRVGAMSLVALDNKGQWGVSTNVEFSFVVGVDAAIANVFIANADEENRKTTFNKPTTQWLEEYDRQHQF